METQNNTSIETLKKLLDERFGDAGQQLAALIQPPKINDPDPQNPQNAEERLTAERLKAADRLKAAITLARQEKTLESFLAKAMFVSAVSTKNTNQDTSKDRETLKKTLQNQLQTAPKLLRVALNKALVDNTTPADPLVLQQLNEKTNPPVSLSDFLGIALLGPWSHGGPPEVLIRE
jgi:hypothetical protein